MRLRRFELRLLAAALAGTWAAACIIFLAWQRPGGPLDLAVGAAAAIPVAIAAAALAWPPTPPGERAVPAMTWLGLVTLLLLLPALGAVLVQPGGARVQALLPSAEAAYPWLLALAGTSLFSAPGIVRRIAGPGTDRRRLAAAGGLATAMTAITAGLLGGAVLADEAALRDRPATASRFGPTDPGLVPPACDGVPAVGATATLHARLDGEVDRRSLGEAVIDGARSGDDVRWTAEVATTSLSGLAGVVMVGGDGFRREPGSTWEAVAASTLAAERLDATILPAALPALRLVAAEDRGLVSVEGARARHCRLAIDGETFRAAVPQVRWFAGERSLHRWRGELDYFVFGDGQLGIVEAWVNGEAEPVVPGAIQATIRFELTATGRGEPVTVEAPSMSGGLVRASSADDTTGGGPAPLAAGGVAGAAPVAAGAAGAAGGG